MYDYDSTTITMSCVVRTGLQCAVSLKCAYGTLANLQLQVTEHTPITKRVLTLEAIPTQMQHCVVRSITRAAARGPAETTMFCLLVLPPSRRSSCIGALAP
jgi:hypothetical protein